MTTMKKEEGELHVGEGRAGKETERDIALRERGSEEDKEREK